MTSQSRTAAYIRPDDRGAPGQHPKEDRFAEPESQSPPLPAGHIEVFLCLAGGNTYDIYVEDT